MYIKGDKALKRRILALVTGIVLSTSIFCGCGDKEEVVDKEVKHTSEPLKEEVRSKNVDTVVKTADEAMELLQEGNERFINDKSELRNINKEKRDSLKEGQNPYAVVISCSDSRVTPSTIFNSGLGEIFDIRLAGNVVDDNALGSIEYAVHHLHTPLIVVIGHESCGAVTTTYYSVVKKEPVEGKVSTIVEKIEPHIDVEGTVDDAINKNVESVVSEVSNNEVVKKLVEEGKVKVVGAHYGLDGKVTFK